ncbi:TMEM175 family protein [Methylomicrobium lacus]|uniref:TMEM175 family protein n=1 Tax=Methylomicrobium lacus TaxID=136992 RepID=UPI00045EC0C5|nr:TMEM175 family protein [Methylomicrobium lacus]
MQRHEEKETGRIEGFSDHVFAIAMTLLVIEIKIPSHELVAAKGLAQSLAALWPSYLAFLTSFFTILVIWVHHHWIFGLIRRIDHPFLYCNGLLLLFVAFVPFPTALIAEYSLHPDAKVAANLYTGTFLAISLTFDMLWRYASKRLLSTNSTRVKKDEAAQITKQYRFGPLLYFAIFGLSFVSETLSLALCLMLALLFALGGWPIRRQ